MDKIKQKLWTKCICGGKAKLLSTDYIYYDDSSVAASDKYLCEDCNLIWYAHHTVFDPNPNCHIHKCMIGQLIEVYGYTYEELSIGALGEVRNINNLMIDEADKIYKYGHNLVRKNHNKNSNEAPLSYSGNESSLIINH